MIETYADPYEDLEKQKDMILAEMEKEENNFRRTLVKGLKELKKIIDKKDQEEMTAVRSPFKDHVKSQNIPLMPLLQVKLLIYTKLMDFP